MTSTPTKGAMTLRLDWTDAFRAVGAEVHEVLRGQLDSGWWVETSFRDRWGHKKRGWFAVSDEWVDRATACNDADTLCELGLEALPKPEDLLQTYVPGVSGSATKVEA